MPPSQGRLTTLLREAKRRNVWRALGLFIGGGWALLQVFDLFIERGFLPEWVFAGAFIALALGLPIVLATAWVQGGGSEWDSERDDGPDFLVHFTWKRAIVGGVLAFAALGFATSVYMVMRVTGVGAPATLTAQGLFEQGSTIVLADFESSVPDQAPGDLVTEALRIDLATSTAFELVPTSQVRAMRDLMLLDPEDPLSEERAREVAARVGSGAVVSGEIGRVGSGFVLTSRVVSAENGDALASFRVTAESEAGLLDAIDELARTMRSKIGESLRSVAATPPLPEQTTTSLEALKKVAEVRNSIDRGAMTSTVAQQLVREAIALDSTFASAHQYLAILILNMGGDRELAAASSDAAYRHRERLTEGERLAVEAHYNTLTVGDFDEAKRVFRRIAQRDSASPVPWTNLGDIHMYAGEYQEAVDALRKVEAFEIGAWRFNLVAAYSGLNEMEMALSILDSTALAVPNDPFSRSMRAIVLTNFDLPQRARESLEAAGRPGGPAASFFDFAQAHADYVQGRLTSGRTRTLESLRAWEEFGSEGDVLQTGMALPWTSMIIEQDSAKARADLDALLERVDWNSLSSYNRNYPHVALTYALIGDHRAALDLVTRFEAEVPALGSPFAVRRAALARGLALVTAGGEEGIGELEAGAAALRCARCADFFLGFGYERAGRLDDAIAAYERYIGSRFWTGFDPELYLFVPAVYERLGHLYAEKGETDRAVEYLARVAALWEGGDTELVERVQAALVSVRAGEP